MSDVTHILNQIENGEDAAAEQLLPLVYDELRKLASVKMADERHDHTLQGTALVHEAYLRLVGSDDRRGWQNRGHFFSAAAEAMRRILVDYARRRNASKRGGASREVNLDTFIAETGIPVDDLLDLNEALSRLEESDPQAARIVSLRVFAGLSIEEAAAALGVPVRSAYRDWTFAQAWLFRELNADAT